MNPDAGSRVTPWRILCGVIGLVTGGFAALAILYSFTPAFSLEPRPGFEASIAVISLLVSGRFLWWAFAPTRLLRKPKRPD
jgi:hypothetical protein